MPEKKGTQGTGRRQALVEQLWERSEEGRKETNSKAKYRNREGMHEKSGRRERGRPKERKQNRSTEEATVRRRQEERERKSRG